MFSSEFSKIFKNIFLREPFHVIAFVPQIIKTRKQFLEQFLTVATTSVIPSSKQKPEFDSTCIKHLV